MARAALYAASATAPKGGFVRFGTFIKTIFITIGVLAILAIFGRMFELKDKDQPRLPIPTQISVPKVDVRR